ncbi:hypothetical protein AV530_010653 [Patagioenas fasciata monilis]|uniref:Uncharacterized protein n=1 Tax=Patagioenas fasciata monilis TaxID=372326 RepID=A0A1V4K388_PATFA|nr:hypothetical protein AV530_010653 [Patagioenas fasciata monilis]
MTSPRGGVHSADVTGAVTSSEGCDIIDGGCDIIGCWGGARDVIGACDVIDRQVRGGGSDVIIGQHQSLAAGSSDITSPSCDIIGGYDVIGG